MRECRKRLSSFTDQMPLSRRRFLQNAAATVIGGSLAAACSRKNEQAEARQLSIYSWPDYIQPEAIPEFERRYGIKVVYDTVSSNEGLIAKFQAGASDYDIVVPSNYAVAKLKELGGLREIERDRLSNFKYLMPRFQTSAFDQDRHYSIPYTFGTTGIAYNQAAPCFENGIFPTDWDSFWDSRIAGRMTLLEDARETIGVALKKQGLSINTRDEKLISAACNDLKKQKKNVMCYTSDQVIVYLTSGDSWLSLAFSGDAQQAAKSNKDIRYIIPRSGASMWVDNLCIPKNAPHPEFAHLWINYMLEPAVAAALSNYTYYASPNQEARKHVNSQLLHDKSLYPADDILDRCEEISDVGKALFVYDRLWTELKCA